MGNISRHEPRRSTAPAAVLLVAPHYMESASHKLLEAAVCRTLHAHSFSRSSSQASLVLTDLFSRYLALLSTTCAKYAQHAGRTSMSIRDAIGALEELGVGVDELSEYCYSEGKELSRYAIHSARRVEDLNEFRGWLGRRLCTPTFYLILSSATCRWLATRS